MRCHSLKISEFDAIQKYIKLTLYNEFPLSRARAEGVGAQRARGEATAPPVRKGGARGCEPEYGVATSF